MIRFVNIQDYLPAEYRLHGCYPDHFYPIHAAVKRLLVEVDQLLEEGNSESLRRAQVLQSFFSETFGDGIQYQSHGQDNIFYAKNEHKALMVLHLPPEIGSELPTEKNWDNELLFRALYEAANEKEPPLWLILTNCFEWRFIPLKEWAIAWDIHALAKERKKEDAFRLQVKTALLSNNFPIISFSLYGLSRLIESKEGYNYSLRLISLSQLFQYDYLFNESFYQQSYFDDSIAELFYILGISREHPALGGKLKWDKHAPNGCIIKALDKTHDFPNQSKEKLIKLVIFNLKRTLENSFHSFSFIDTDQWELDEMIKPDTRVAVFSNSITHLGAGTSIHPLGYLELFFSSIHYLSAKGDVCLPKGTRVAWDAFDLAMVIVELGEIDRGYISRKDLISLDIKNSLRLHFLSKLNDVLDKAVKDWDEAKEVIRQMPIEGRTELFSEFSTVLVLPEFAYMITELFGCFVEVVFDINEYPASMRQNGLFISFAKGRPYFSLKQSQCISLPNDQLSDQQIDALWQCIERLLGFLSGSLFATGRNELHELLIKLCWTLMIEGLFPSDPKKIPWLDKKILRFQSQISSGNPVLSKFSLKADANNFDLKKLAQLKQADPKQSKLIKLKRQYFEHYQAPSLLSLDGNDNSPEKDIKRKHLLQQIQHLQSSSSDSLLDLNWAEFLNWGELYPEQLDQRQEFEGFDLVILSPPSLSQAKLNWLNPYLRERFASYESQGNFQNYFAEIGLRLLKGGGLLMLVASDKVMQAGYSQKFNQWLGEQSEIMASNKMKTLEKRKLSHDLILLARKSTIKRRPHLPS